MGLAFAKLREFFLYNKVEGKVALQIETNKCFDCVIFESNYQHVVFLMVVTMKMNWKHCCRVVDLFSNVSYNLTFI